MSFLKSHLLKIVIGVNLLFLFSCTFTQSFTPQFNRKQAEVLDSIKTKYGFEDISFVGKKKSGNGGTSTSLTVKLINGKNIPTDETKMTELAQQLATQVKNILKSPKDFDTYIILFDTVVTNGNTTNENYVGHEFKLSEI